MNRNSLLYLFFLVLFVPLCLNAQVAEDEIRREGSFIDANREKLLGNFDKAISILRELHRQDAENAGITYELGRLYKAQGDTEEAVRFLKKSTELDPSNEWYPKFLADIYQEEGRNKEGAELYQKLVKQSPNDQYLYFKQAYFLVKAQEINKALKVYNELEKRVGYNEEIARRKHTLFMGMGDIPKAEKELVRLIEAYPDRLDFLHHLASFYETKGDQKDAIRVYEKIISRSPSDPKAALALSGKSTIKNDEIQYLAAMIPAFERTDVDLDLKISKLLPFITNVANTGDKAIAEAAIQLTDILETVHGGDAKVFAASGDLHYHSGQLKKAAIKYQETVDRDKNVFPVWMQLLTCHYEMGDFESLLKVTNNALDVYPNRAILQFYLALADDALNNYDNALADLQLAGIMAGKNTDLLTQIKALEGQIYYHKNQNDKALNHFNEAMQLNDESPEFNYRYGQYLLATGDIKQAKNKAKKAATEASFNPYYTYGWAKILYVSTDYKAAKEQLDLALKAGASYWSSALELAGDIQFQLKNIDEAVQWWQKALEKGGTSEQLHNKISNRSL